MQKTYKYSQSYFIMNIGIDIDDVLLKNTEAFIEFIKNHGYNVKLDEFKSRRIWEILSCTKKQSEDLINNYFKSDFFLKMEIMPDADKVLKKIKNKFTIFAVTNRPESTKIDTLNSLNKYFGDSIKEVIFLGQYQKDLNEESSKKKIIEDKLKAIYYIEDDADIINQLDKNKTKIILFSKPWNKLIKQVKRVSNWEEIEDYILKDAIF
jgi:5'(3')-deoxyribonucleotidase